MKKRDMVAYVNGVLPPSSFALKVGKLVNDKV